MLIIQFTGAAYMSTDLTMTFYNPATAELVNAAVCVKP